MNPAAAKSTKLSTAAVIVAVAVGIAALQLRLLRIPQPAGRLRPRSTSPIGEGPCVPRVEGAGVSSTERGGEGDAEFFFSSFFEGLIREGRREERGNEERGQETKRGKKKNSTPP